MEEKRIPRAPVVASGAAREDPTAEHGFPSSVALAGQPFVFHSDFCPTFTAHLVMVGGSGAFYSSLSSVPRPHSPFL